MRSLIVPHFHLSSSHTFTLRSLRNAALLAADTPLVAMVDVDLLLSRGLAEELRDARRCGGCCGGCCPSAQKKIPTPPTLDDMESEHPIGPPSTIPPASPFKDQGRWRQVPREELFSSSQPLRRQRGWTWTGEWWQRRGRQKVGTDEGETQGKRTFFRGDRRASSLIQGASLSSWSSLHPRSSSPSTRSGMPWDTPAPGVELENVWIPGMAGGGSRRLLDVKGGVIHR